MLHTVPPVYQKSDYRPDIDGLRAIAILAVIIYHAFPKLLPGGFTGVDIFFVISGYLISKHIWEDLAAESFSIRTFYARRVRRIFPALSVILLVSLALGWLILAPSEYERLAKHVEGGAGFVANLFYWKEAGYFDTAADTKPLLHLWSLGIEEQFYIAWPLILVFLWRRPHHAPWVMPGVLVSSFLYSLWLVRHNPVADFYSPLSRCWELALGAVLAHHVLHRFKTDQRLHELLAWAGLVLITAGIVLIDNKMPFPGYWALLPTLGTASMILAGEQSWLNRRLLSLNAMVWVGLISYPLYLWHWPLLSFARIMNSATPPPAVRAVLLAVSVLLAWLTYLWVERPVRTRPRTRRLVLTLCLIMFVLLLTGETIRKLSGIQWRNLSMLNGNPATLVLGADRSRLQHQCGLTASQQEQFDYCLRSAPHARFAVLGDSKGEALLYGLVRESAPKMQWKMLGSVTAPGEPGLPNASLMSKSKIAWKTIEQDPDVRTVLLVMALRAIFTVDRETGFIAGKAPPGTLARFDHAISKMERAGKRVVFVIDNPTFADPRSCISGGLTSSKFLNQFLFRRVNPRCTLRYTDYMNGTRAYRDFIAKLKQLHPGMTVYDPTPLLCDTAHNVCNVTRNGQFLYSYSDHISDVANSMLAKDMLPMLRRLTH
jgi:peptidoglycan/LPS O-acetylase OafA/YrhL